MVSYELGIILGILRESAEKFSILDREAEANLLVRDIKSYQLKLEEGAQLLTELPGKIAILASDLKGDDINHRVDIIIGLERFAFQASKAMISGNLLCLGSLPINKGVWLGEKNELEKLIERIEAIA